jgi:hyaluronoglucosaminidase
VPDKVFGIVEGFYRRPYTFKQRIDLIDFISRLGLNTYIYGPKADPFHRKHWQRVYPEAKLRAFKELNARCADRSINFVYALSPREKPTTKKVLGKIDSMIRIGMSNFSLFFDDIAVPLTKEIAQLQVNVANELYEHLTAVLKKTTLAFCPTQYRGFRKTEYITYVGEHLYPDIDVFWTGKYVVSPAITEADINRITTLVKRPVLIWDNIFANDYIPGKILRFPYRRRTPGIIEKVRGIVLNPMNNYRQSKPLITTAAQFFAHPFDYDPKRAWKQATG